MSSLPIIALPISNARIQTFQNRLQILRNKAANWTTAIERVDRRWLLLVISITALLAYAGLRSNAFDKNGIIEVHAIEQGNLYSQNHLLYRPLVAVLGIGLRLLGYDGLLVYPAQWLTAVLSAVGVVCYFAWLRLLLGRTALALLMTAGFALAWSQWMFSVDVFYITPAVTTCIITVWLLTQMTHHDRAHIDAGRIVGMALLCGLGVLFWQANIFFAGGIGLSLILFYRHSPIRAIGAAILFGEVLVVIILTGYLAASHSALGERWTIQSLINWLTNYGGARLTIWGELDLARIPYIVRNSINSIVDTRGLADALEVITVGSFLKLFSVASYIGLFLPLLFKRWRANLPEPTLWLLLLGYSLLLPFIFWWDPFEMKWFVVPNLFFWAIIGVLWNSAPRPAARQLLLPIFIGCIAAANLFLSILPMTPAPSAEMQETMCLVEHMGKQDLFVALHYERWGNYLEYFYGQPLLHVVDTIGRSADKAQFLSQLRARTAATLQSGAQVVLQAPSDLWPGSGTWLTYLIGLQPEDLSFLASDEQFTCGNATFLRVSSAQSRLESASAWALRVQPLVVGGITRRVSTAGRAVGDMRQGQPSYN